MDGWMGTWRPLSRGMAGSTVEHWRTRGYDEKQRDNDSDTNNILTYFLLGFGLLLLGVSDTLFPCCWACMCVCYVLWSFGSVSHHGYAAV